MTTEHMDSHASRVLALLKRQPGMTVGEMAASLSGMVHHEVRKALYRLRDAGRIQMKSGTQQTWSAVAPVEASAVEPQQCRMGLPPYVPAYEPPARSEGLLHTLVGSRRGNDVVPFALPLGMMNGFLGDKGNHSHIQLVTKQCSPLYGNTFCKLAPDAKPGRKKVVA